jgi:DNA-binding transcriptional MerR regulator
MKHAALTIGDLGRATGTKVVTIRYYERIGILGPADRTSGNFRTYGPADRDRLGFIRRCRKLGFTLDQVRDLLRLSSEESRDCGEVDRLAAAHLAVTEEKIADLTRLAAELRRIISSCEGGGPVADCRIIEALKPGGADGQTS